MPKLKKIVVATGNPAKLRRNKILVEPFVEEVLGLDSFDLDVEPVESGDTAEENSQIKALFYTKALNLPVLAEDSSLFVDFLPKDKQPGVYVRRINGKDEVTDDELFEYWENLVREAPEDKRRGHWHACYTIGFPDGKNKTVSKDFPNIFFYPPSKKRIPGWPMSSLQGPEQFNKPHCELTEDEQKMHEGYSNKALMKKMEELFEWAKNHA